MGDRALIQLTNKSGEVSPVLYMHWSGSSVAAILCRAQDQMKGRANDVDYAFARLVQQATGRDLGNTGFGVWNQSERLTADDSHGDAGCFVVDVSTEAWAVAQGGGYGLGDEHSFPVTGLQQVSA
jgi:hypothetical protein